ncbi:hypothetical protein WMC70_10975 [Klebsiella variicola]|uniref:hypothetical protein n=1 Tax=Klebsiella variicola TaxID=244366 RepID=UPI000E2BB46D|nr:hypothetical protein [Klebsiella variicola]SXE31877.1 Uncharacterised protein [Klebsiella variicola]
MTSFTGGEAMEKKLAEIADNLGEERVLKVGILKGASYPDGTSVAMVAAANEFGDPSANRPPRPFFRSMIAECSPQWPEEISKILKATGYDGKATFSLMGERIAGQLQNSIRETYDPPLSPRTVRRKGFDKPLIDTSHMLNSVSYEVNEVPSGPVSFWQKLVNFFRR